MSKNTIVPANRKHKDRLFCYIFGHEENKEYLLSLYNALNHSNYENPDELEITTLEDAIYMSMKNDVSFLISDYMNLFEHQSTINPNMPLRGFLYFARLYESYLSKHRLNVYGCKQILIPTPQYFIFYNGEKEAPERQEYRLSDAFLKQDDSKKFEWTATMVNINVGHNGKLMQQCQALEEYAGFVENVRTLQDVYQDMDKAVDEAVKRAEQGPCLGEFFRKNRAEVSHMILTEFDQEAFADTMREEGEEINIIKLVCKNMLKGRSVLEIADFLDEDEEEITRIYEIAKEQLPDYDVDDIFRKLNTRHF